MVTVIGYCPGTRGVPENTPVELIVIPAGAPDRVKVGGGWLVEVQV